MAKRARGRDLEGELRELREGVAEDAQRLRRSLDEQQATRDARAALLRHEPAVRRRWTVWLGRLMVSGFPLVALIVATILETWAIAALAIPVLAAQLFIYLQQRAVIKRAEKDLDENARLALWGKRVPARGEPDTSELRKASAKLDDDVASGPPRSLVIDTHSKLPDELLDLDDAAQVVEPPEAKPAARAAAASAAAGPGRTRLLNAQQQAALRDAAAEFEWSNEEAAMLRYVAEQGVLRPTRKDQHGTWLESVRDWAELRTQVQRWAGGDDRYS
jgi:hypothetical protein